MKTVIITDGKYRSSIPAARALGRAGYNVVVTQTRGDDGSTPPVFSFISVTSCDNRSIALRLSKVNPRV